MKNIHVGGNYNFDGLSVMSVMLNLGDEFSQMLLSFQTLSDNFRQPKEAFRLLSVCLLLIFMNRAERG